MVDIRGWWLTQLHAKPPIEFGWGIKVIALAGLIVAYLLVVPLKVAGYLPVTVTWVGVVLLPAIMFLALASVLILPVQTVRQRWFLAGFRLGCYLVGMGLVYWQGWH